MTGHSRTAVTHETDGDGGLVARRAMIYLADEAVDDIGDLIQSDTAADIVDLDPVLGVEARIYFRRPDRPVADPGPVPAAGPGEPLAGVTTPLADAALVLRFGSRLLAFAFGQGRHLLRPELLVDDAGTRLALDTVDLPAIRDLDGRGVLSLIEALETMEWSALVFPDSTRS